MNTIERSIIRGLLSGEIKAQPQVFEHLRQLSERRSQGHRRILRFVRPTAARVRAAEPGRPSLTRRDGGSPVEVPQGHLRRSFTSSSFRRSWSTFANVSCGRWIRLTACLLGAGIVLGFGVTDVQAGVPVATGERATLSGTTGLHGVVQTVHGLTDVLHPFTQNLLIVSGSMLVGLLMVTGWEWFCRRKLFVMRPYEMALQQLESTQHRVEQGNVSDPRRAVLGILWKYVQEQYQLRLPEAGRDAILRALTRRPTLLSPCQKLLLRDVLDSMANAPTSSSGWFSELTDKASLFVWATAGGRVRRQATLKAAGQVEPGDLRPGVLTERRGRVTVLR